MLRTGYVIDSRYENHATPHGHPERPERIGVLLELLAEMDRGRLIALPPRAATPEEILLNHDQQLIDMVRSTSTSEHFSFDPDTHTSSSSFETALLATGGLLELVDHVMDRKIDNGFAFVRPPGHHAEQDRAMGFCFFNNVAIAARYLQKKHGLERVVIMDWDVHHGNGTQRSFYGDNDVLYVSTHQYPFYPGTGAAEEIGEGHGSGFNVNVPFPAGFGDAEYVHAFTDVVEPICRQFDPQFVLISAGFDCHALDPLGGMHVSDKGMRSIARSLLAVAKDHCRGKCAAVLEGGYSLEALKESAAVVLDEFAKEESTVGHGREMGRGIVETSGAGEIIARVRDIHQSYWKL